MPGKSLLPRWVFLIDIFVGAFSVLFAWTLVSTHPALAAHTHGAPSFLDVMFYVSFVVIVLTSIALNRDYEPEKRYSRLGEMDMVLRSCVIAFVLLVSSAFVLEDFIIPDLYVFSRPGIIILSIAFATLLMSVRVSAHYVQTCIFGHGKWRRRIIIVGAGPEGLGVFQHMKTKDWLGVKCVGFVDPTLKVSPVPEAPLLGTVEDLSDVIKSHEVEEVIIALPPADHEIMEGIVNSGIRQAVKVRIIPDSFAYAYSQVDIQEYDGLAMIDVKQPNLVAMHGGLKRIMDIVLALLLLVFNSFVMLIVAVIISLTSRGPVIYRQTRLGKNGNSFEMMKFRSMVVGAHDQRARLKEKNEASGPFFKMKEDPRTTGFGRIIRLASLDELPQLLNVLRGDMSLVGPRPPLPEEVVRYGVHHLKRLAVRPGLTGLWQVSGRDRRDFEEMAKLDLYYIENWSIKLDLKIILKTIPAVLTRRGAY
ncbi:MAG: sugar transferase [Thermoleophilia bacterium]